MFVGATGEVEIRDGVGVGVLVRGNVAAGVPKINTVGVIVDVRVGVGVSVGGAGEVGDGGAPRAVTRKIIISPSNKSAKTQPLNIIVSCKRFF